MNSNESSGDDRPISWFLVFKKITCLIGIFLLWGAAYSVTQQLVRHFLLPTSGTHNAASAYAIQAAVIMVAVSAPFLLWWLRVLRNYEVRGERAPEIAGPEKTISPAVLREAVDVLAGRWRLSGGVASWVAAGVALAIVLSLMFPPWVLPQPGPGRSMDVRLGYGTFFAPPKNYLEADSAACVDAIEKERKHADRKRRRTDTIQKVQARIQAGDFDHLDMYVDEGFDEYLDRVQKFDYSVPLLRIEETSAEDVVDKWIAEAADGLTELHQECQTTVRRMVARATIDYVRLAAHVLAILAIGSFAWLATRLVRRAG